MLRSKMIELHWPRKKARIVLNMIRRSFIRRANNLKIYRDNLRDKQGIEIGGPSRILNENGILPIYSVLGNLDGCNFSNETIWEGKSKEGWTYNYQKDKKPGYQYICEAANLSPISSEAYDFVISSHSIEHLANPLKAISEWKRILKDDGLLLLVVPHKDKTFDHNRPVTSLNHLVEDLENDMGEDDLTHLPDILELHDLKQDSKAGDLASFTKRSQNNYINRCLHHHVFDTRLVMDMVEHMGLTIITSDFVPPFHIIVLAKYKK